MKSTECFKKLEPLQHDGRQVSVTTTTPGSFFFVTFTFAVPVKSESSLDQKPAMTSVSPSFSGVSFVLHFTTLFGRASLQEQRTNHTVYNYRRIYSLVKGV